MPPTPEWPPGLGRYHPGYIGGPSQTPGDSVKQIVGEGSDIYSSPRSCPIGRAVCPVAATYLELVPRSRVDSELHAGERVARAREQLARLSPGGSPERAIRVASASVIESRAAAMPCPQCSGLYRILEHTRPVPGLRRVDVACRYCGVPRTLWFRIADHEPN